MEIVRILILGVLIGVILLLLGGIGAILEVTIVNTPMLCAGVTLFSLFISPVIGNRWQWLTQTRSKAINWSLNVVVCSIMGIAAVLMVNYFGKSEGSLHPTPAVIERCYKETKYQTRRVSRKVSVRGAPYKVYRLEIRIADHFKNIKVDKKMYDEAAKGDTLYLDYGRGALGIDIIDKDGAWLNTPRVKRKSRCRGIYTTGRSREKS